MVNFLKIWVLTISRLLKMDEIPLTQDAIVEFDRLYQKLIESGESTLSSHSSSYPIYMFLNYIIEKKAVLIHGSNHPEITSFEPRESALFSGKPIKAVFASSDGIWSLFFAVVNRNAVHSLRNLCISIPARKGVKRYYYFSIDQGSNHDVWTKGTIYVLPKKLFKQGGIKNEWVCEQEVKPLAKIKVIPKDFPFLKKVSRHKETDSMIKTMANAFFVKK
ncbi:hypothetical protein [Heyndrickxia acidicola]|uniref:FRG domain-containing protein n=1 Tax=Heyndrickxia acidicola TaxID=209389 RepID=A0ABU6MHF8_9BACI|nr:hypothetical protein [Heyndrickxia acidicola]MED1204109.1 hypothetical protein [Heyndrickxia acidicola]